MIWPVTGSNEIIGLAQVSKWNWESNKRLLQSEVEKLLVGIGFGPRAVSTHQLLTIYDIAH